MATIIYTNFIPLFAYFPIVIIPTFELSLAMSFVV